MKIRNVTINDLDSCAKLEKSLFPPEEAASKETYAFRIENMGDWFFVGEEDGQIVGLVIGRPTKLDVISDVMYETSELEPGPFIAILSIATDQNRQRQGIAGQLMKHLLKEAEKAGFQGVTLACKDNLLRYYENLGFRLIGTSASTHGDVRWNDMRVDFQNYRIIYI